MGTGAFGGPLRRQKATSAVVASATAGAMRLARAVSCDLASTTLEPAFTTVTSGQMSYGPG
ncbi:hypothetical protein FHR32_004082 [Streptosporangium album]|uniref:Uncharacterized protein n=1 Tax=Streptosporangium album TaxID=47479 RepID=A0A7W7W9V4_9ACTN|nr:hypothetical protein [Streptosporangium album]MBB4939777.1 hypothetical protein [Streptosporangium album]